MTAGHYIEAGAWPQDEQSSSAPVSTSVLNEAYAWLALLPMLFITVGGNIATADSGPVAFRFTAMEDASPGRKLMRFGCSLLILFLLTARLRAVAEVCKRAKLLFLLPALAFVSVAWSHNVSHALVDAANLAVTTLLAVYLFVRYPREKLLSFLMLGAFVSLVLSILAVVAVPAIGMDAYQDGAWRGIFGQRNNCAMICVLFLTLAAHSGASSFVERTMRGSVIGLSLLFIVMSGSRTGWLAAVIALAVSGGLKLLARAASVERVLMLMLAAIALFLVVYGVTTNLTELLAVLDKDPTMSQRTVIWAEVLPSIAKHPLIGYGYSSFWNGLNGDSMQAVLTTGWMEGQAQDGYLDVLLQLGLLGLVPLIFLFVRGFIHGARALEQRRADNVVRLSIVLLLLVLLENIGESSFLLPLGMPWFYALLSLLVLSVPQTAEVL